MKENHTFDISVHRDVQNNRKVIRLSVDGVKYHMDSKSARQLGDELFKQGCIAAYGYAEEAK